MIAIEGADIPLVQTLTFIFAVLIVAFNLVADVVYADFRPKIRYDWHRNFDSFLKFRQSTVLSGWMYGTVS